MSEKSDLYIFDMVIINYQYTIKTKVFFEDFSET